MLPNLYLVEYVMFYVELLKLVKGKGYGRSTQEAKV